MNINNVPRGLRVAQSNYTGGGTNLIAHINKGLVDTNLFDRLYNNVIGGNKNSRKNSRKKGGKKSRKRS